MKIIKKITAAFLAGVMAVTALCAVAGADTIFDTKATLTSGKKTTVKYSKSMEEKNFKFKVSKSGTLKFVYSLEGVNINFYLYDSEGTPVSIASKSVKSGDLYTFYDDTNVDTKAGYNSGIGSGEFTYKVKKGTYYLKTVCGWDSGKLKLTATFPTSDEGTSDAKIDALTLSVKKGTKLSFGTMITGTADLSDIKWSTSDKKVATVSSTGTVKAVAKGSATITAKIGSSSVKIIIKVTA